MKMTSPLFFVNRTFALVLCKTYPCKVVKKVEKVDEIDDAVFADDNH